jgi:hypothetical protein
MIPVAMLVINAGALSSVFLTFFYLIMTRLSLVVYLTLVIVEAIILISETSAARFSPVLIPMLGGTIWTHLALSLLINIYATSIIALKAWYVCHRKPSH